MRWIGVVAVGVAGALALAACTATPATPGADTPGTSTPSREADMDKAAVTAAIEELPGVASAEVGAYNTGRPGAYALRVAITVDESGRDELGRVVDGAVRAVAADPGDYESADFEVTAPDEAEPDDLIVLTLARYQERIPFDEGAYLGSTLTLTAAEVAAVAAR